MSMATTTLERLGFDALRLRFTMRTALAACLAIAVAWLAGLEHPQWSGMTVWAVSLPVRSHLLEKSAFRALGTIIGTVFGIALMLVSDGQSWIIVVGLAVWIGLCAAAGNIIRGFASYGAMLAGYTAAMVVLLHSEQSSGPFAVGVDRMMTVLIGLLIALLAGWAFAARGFSEDPASRVKALSRRILQDLRACLEGAGRPSGEEYHRLLSEMAAIEDTLDQHAAGSLRSREAIKRIRRTLLAQVAILLWMRRDIHLANSAPLTEALLEAENAYPQDLSPDILHKAAALADDIALREALSGLAAAARKGRSAMMAPRDAERLPVLALHRDWIGACEALFRSAFVILAVGLIWLLTGWEGASFMMLGAAIMTTVFSTFENPTPILRQVILGQALGIIGALVCRWLVWPYAGSEAGLVLSMMPFVLIGGLFFGHRRGSGSMGFDCNMAVLLLLQPLWPLSGSFAHSLSVGLAVILGPAIGLMAFLLIFPLSSKRRLKALIAMMTHEIEAMAASPGASRRRLIWRARLYHRVLRLAHWVGKTKGHQQEVIDAGLALLLAGSSILHIDELSRQPETGAGMARRLSVTRARLRQFGSNPQKAANSLNAMAHRLADVPGADAGLLRETAAELFATRNFIRQIHRS